MFTVKIDDGFCEWTYKFDNGDSLCIQDIADVITKHTPLVEIKSFLSRENDFDSDPKSCVNQSK